MSERSPEQVIADAHRIDAFLNDEAIVAAFKRMESRFYAEFVAADSSEKRIVAQSKAKVLNDIAGELKSILDRGEWEMLQAAKLARKRAADTPSPQGS